MRNLVPSHALVRRARQLLQLAFLVVAGGAFVSVAGIFLFVVPLAPPNNQLYHTFRSFLFIFGIIIGLIGAAVAIRAVTWKTDNELAIITGNFLSQHLDDRFTFIRNVSKFGLGYIDAVLVGPPGALVFRILDKEGVFLNDATKWLRQVVQDSKQDWVPAMIDPTRETVADIRSLREYLAKHRLPDIPVFGIIVFTKDESAVKLHANEPVVPMTHLSHLVTNLRPNYLAKDRIDMREVSAITQLLLGQQ